MKIRCHWNKAVCIVAVGAAMGMGVHSTQAQGMSGRMSGSMKGSMAGGMGSMHMQEARMLIDTLSEEKTEINTLAAQQAVLKSRGGRRQMKLANLFGRMIVDHKAGGPKLKALIRKHGGDPNSAKILKPPALGSEAQMLQADMADHMKAESTSQMRYGMSKDPAAKAFYKKRMGIARKHMVWMKPYTKGMSMSGGMQGHHMSGGMR